MTNQAHELPHLKILLVLISVTAYSVGCVSAPRCSDSGKLMVSDPPITKEERIIWACEDNDCRWDEIKKKCQCPTPKQQLTFLDAMNGILLGIAEGMGKTQVR